MDKDSLVYAGSWRGESIDQRYVQEMKKPMIPGLRYAAGDKAVRLINLQVAYISHASRKKLRDRTRSISIVIFHISYN